MWFKINPAPFQRGIKSHWKGLSKYSYISASEPRDIIKRCGIKSQKKVLIVCAFSIFLLVFFVYSNGVRANDYGLNQTLSVNGLNNALTKNSDLSVTIGTIVGAVLAFVGVIFLILMIYGGFLWMTAGGNEQQVDKAKNLITAAIIGLIIIFAAYAITAYIGGELGQTSPPAAGG